MRGCMKRWHTSPLSFTFSSSLSRRVSEGVCDGRSTSTYIVWRIPLRQPGLAPTEISRVYRNLWARVRGTYCRFCIRTKERTMSD